MATELEKWAAIERQFLKDDIEWLKAGGVLKSPSGDNITDQKLEQLKARLEHVNKVLSEA
tara:strand:+ start:2462 stop:2641 length:180 start_codon:yes stop_codon:yes gene_type:complete